MPKRLVAKLQAQVESIARQIEEVLSRLGGLTEHARAEIRNIMNENMGQLEYLVLVREDSYGEVHTNHLREGIYFNDPVGLQCAAVTQTTAFFYPRDTGEQLIDVSTPVFYQGKKAYVLRSGQLLPGISRHVKIGVPFLLLQAVGSCALFLPQGTSRILLGGAALTLALLIILWDRIQFQRTYRSWIHFLRTLGKGELEYRLPPLSRDEFGQMHCELNKMGLGLAAILRQVHASVIQVNAVVQALYASVEQTRQANQHIATVIDEMAAGSEKQASNTDEITTSIHEMSNVVQQIASNAQHASSTAMQASDLAVKGRESIHYTIQQMKTIQESVTSLTHMVEQLGQRSRSIGQIVQVITDIATQTNLLALNAAIEAARAGEQGRGFAIVADEVRKLAEQAEASTKQIIDLISGIQKDTDSAIATTGITIKEVTAGMEAVHGAEESFAQIQRSVQAVADQFADVSTAVQQMAAGAEHVSQGMQLIAEVAVTTASRTQAVSADTEEQVSALDEITAAFSTLTQMAENLQALVARFHVSAPAAPVEDQPEH